MPGVAGRDPDLQEEVQHEIIKAVRGMYVESFYIRYCANLHQGFCLQSFIAALCARLSANAIAGVKATARKILSTAPQASFFMVGFLLDVFYYAVLFLWLAGLLAGLLVLFWFHRDQKT